MKKDILLKVLYNRRGNTLTVWFDDPKNEYICEETGDEIIIKFRNKER